MSIESVIPSNQLILCTPLLLLPSIFPSLRVLSSESALDIREPKYWSYTFSINPSNEYSGLISLGLTGLISLQSRGLSRAFSSTTVWKPPGGELRPSSQSPTSSIRCVSEGNLDAVIPAEFPDKCSCKSEHSSTTESRRTFHHEKKNFFLIISVYSH